MGRGSYSVLTATIDINRDSEFTGDDVDQFSSLVNLGRRCDKVKLTFPSLTASAVNLYGQEGSSTSTVPKVIHAVKADISATAVLVITSNPQNTTVVVPCGYQYIRVRCTTNQAADRAIICVGV